MNFKGGGLSQNERSDTSHMNSHSKITHLKHESLKSCSFYLSNENRHVVIVVLQLINIRWFFCIKCDARLVIEQVVEPAIDQVVN